MIIATYKQESTQSLVELRVKYLLNIYQTGWSVSGGDDGVVISDHPSLLIQCSPDVFRKREQAFMCLSVIESQVVARGRLKAPETEIGN